MTRPEPDDRPDDDADRYPDDADDADDADSDAPAQVRLSRGCTIALVAGFGIAFLATSLVLLIVFLTS